MTKARDLARVIVDSSGLIASGNLGNAVPADGSITTAKLANDAVDASKIAANAVGASELAETTVSAGSYTNTNLTVDADGRITAASSGAAASGTVSSVATGNGLQGGTITTSGTLSVACPAFNTVGSYAQVQANGDNANHSSGTNYAAGAGFGQLMSTQLYLDGSGFMQSSLSINLSGTWKWMGSSSTRQAAIAIACRVS